MKRKFLQILMNVICILFLTSCSVDDSDESTDPETTVSNQIIGTWAVVKHTWETYDGGTTEVTYEEPCLYFKFLPQGRFQRTGCVNSVSNGEYTVLDDQHIELLDYNQFGDDAIVNILEISSNTLVLDWVQENNGLQTTYYFEKEE